MERDRRQALVTAQAVGRVTPFGALELQETYALWPSSNRSKAVGVAHGWTQSERGLRQARFAAPSKSPVILSGWYPPSCSRWRSVRPWRKDRYKLFGLSSAPGRGHERAARAVCGFDGTEFSSAGTSCLSFAKEQLPQVFPSTINGGRVQGGVAPSTELGWLPASFWEAVQTCAAGTSSSSNFSASSPAILSGGGGSSAVSQPSPLAGSTMWRQFSQPLAAVLWLQRQPLAA